MALRRAEAPQEAVQEEAQEEDTQLEEEGKGTEEAAKVQEEAQKKEAEVEVRPPRGSQVLVPSAILQMGHLGEDAEEEEEASYQDRGVAKKFEQDQKGYPQKGYP